MHNPAWRFAPFMILSTQMQQRVSGSWPPWPRRPLCPTVATTRHSPRARRLRLHSRRPATAPALYLGRAAAASGTGRLRAAGRSRACLASGSRTGGATGWRRTSGRPPGAAPVGRGRGSGGWRPWATLGPHCTPATPPCKHHSPSRLPTRRRCSAPLLHNRRQTP
jgi:hypothetical protein